MELVQFRRTYATPRTGVRIEGEVGAGERTVGRLDLSVSGTSGVIPFCLTSQARLSTEP